MDPWWLRLALWARNPPSPRMAAVVALILLVALVAAGLEWLGLWPDWAEAQRVPGRRVWP